MTNVTDAEWVLKAMAAMAAADHRLDAREVRLIQEVYEEQTGLPVDVSGVITAVQTYAKRDVLEDLSAVAGGLSPEAKEAIVRGACLTLLANEHISESERKKLEAIAAALGISEEQLTSVLDQACEDRPKLSDL